jgi:dTMP kinase
LENRIVPALRAGFVVLADRYIYTLMARAIVRGAEPEWVASVYAMAIVPDAVFYLTASLPTLVQRTFQSHAELDYWESGMDCGLSRDWFQSFVRYQRRIRSEFFKMQKKYDFELVNANRTIAAVDRDLQGRIQLVLDRAATREVRRERHASASRDADTSGSPQALPRRRTRKAPAV